MSLHKLSLRLQRPWDVVLLLHLIGVYSTCATAQVFVPKNQQTVYGRITDEQQRPLIARVELWRQPLQAISAGSPDNLIAVSYSSDLGFYGIEVPEGTYLLRYTKGPEYECKEEEIIVGKDEYDGIEKNIELGYLYPLAPKGWYGGDVHLHSWHSDGRNTPTELVQGLKAAGLSWGILTDHNSYAGEEEWLAMRTVDFLPLMGNEITTEHKQQPGKAGFGHLNQWFVSSAYATDATNRNIWLRAMLSDHSQVQQAIDATHQQRGLIAVNHPFTDWDWAGRFRSWGIVEGFDAVEIWNGDPPLCQGISPPNEINRNTVALQIWFELLNAGNHVLAVGGSDVHDIHSGEYGWPKSATHWRIFPGNSRTYVKLTALMPDELKRALAGGNAFVTSGFGPLLLVNVDGHEPGTVVKMKRPSLARVQVAVLSNRPLLHAAGAVRIVINGSEVAALATHGETKWETLAAVDIDKDSWLVVIAFGQYPQLAIANPIYFDVAPFGDWHAQHWRHPKEARKWNEFLKHPRITISNGPDGPND